MLSSTPNTVKFKTIPSLSESKMFLYVRLFHSTLLGRQVTLAINTTLIIAWRTKRRTPTLQTNFSREQFNCFQVSCYQYYTVKEKQEIFEWCICVCYDSAEFYNKRQLIRGAFVVVVVHLFFSFLSHFMTFT